MKTTFFGAVAAAVVAAGLGLSAQPRQTAPACDPDNGGITLPDGFCALVAADNLGAARHIAVNTNGDVYVALQGNRQGVGAGVVGLRDTNGDGKMDVTEKFGDKSTTGIAIRNGYIYTATTSSVERFKMTAGELEVGPAEVVVADLPITTPHQDKGLAFDGAGGLYVSVGAPSNACQPQDRRPRLAGQDPCPMLANSGGVWKFDENKLEQKQTDGTLYSTGLRQMPALTWHNGALYTVMNSRDQIDTLWPEKFQAEDNLTRPAEPMYRLEQGGHYGWPYCYEDLEAKALILNPEYGGDGSTVGRCAEFKRAIATYPPHWAPVDVTFYTGAQFPQKYRGGAFIAFHGSWNRPPEQQGYNVVFQPFANNRPAGDYEVFASGFTGVPTVRNAQQAAYRPDGVMQAPDGSLYISESNKGRLWRVIYKGSGAR